MQRDKRKISLLLAGMKVMKDGEGKATTWKY